MGTRRDFTRQYARDYAKEAKKAQGRDSRRAGRRHGRSRANARRALFTARERKGPAKAVVRMPRGRTYGYGALKVLIEVWRFAGMPSGKYLAATMDLWLPKLEALGLLHDGRYPLQVHRRRARTRDRIRGSRRAGESGPNLAVGARRGAAQDRSPAPEVLLTKVQHHLWQVQTCPVAGPSATLWSSAVSSVTAETSSSEVFN
jgi:hypothetical protein